MADPRKGMLSLTTKIYIMAKSKNEQAKTGKAEKIKKGKSTTAGGKDKNIGGQSGSMAGGKGETTGSKGSSGS
jgi:hypothetical protein